MRTRTVTATRTREFLLCCQFGHVCVWLLPDGKRLYQTVVEPALRARAINGLTVLATHSDNGDEIELRLTVDWSAHARAVECSAEFTAPARWQNLVSENVGEAVHVLGRLIAKEGLTVSARLLVAPGMADHPTVAHLPRRPRRRVNANFRESRPVDGLGEMAVELRLRRSDQ